MGLNIIEQIDERAEQLNVSISELCEQAEVSKTTFYRWLEKPPLTLVLLDRLLGTLSSLEKEVSQVNLDALEERVLDLIRKKRVPWWKKVMDLLGSRKLLIPAAAMAVLLLFFSIMWQPAPVSAPSAIVKPFSGDVSSVMIIETPKSRNVIIWYNESS